MPDAEWRAPSVEAHVKKKQTQAPPADSEPAGRTPLWVGLLRLALAAGAVATGSPWAVLIVLWIILAHVLLED